MKKPLASLLAALLLVSASGCQSATGSPSPSQAAQPSASQEVQPSAQTGEAAWSSEHYDESMKGTTINLYGVTDAIIPVLDAFYEDTGIKVENLTLKNGEILQRIANEKEAGTVIADVWFTGGADAFISAADSGLLTAYQSPEAADIADDMKDVNGYWTGTSLTVVNWVVNTEVIEELGIEVPTQWDDLLQPELEGLVSMPDPASSGTAYNTISAILQTRGEEAGWAYLDQLIQQVPYFTARGSDPANNVIAGEAAVGINAGTGNKSLEEDYPQVELVYPTDGTGWWPQPVAILEGCSHPEEAKVLIDWLLSDRGLEEVGKAQNAMLVKDNVPAPEGIMALSEIALFPTDFKANAADRDAILAQWAEKVGN